MIYFIFYKLGEFICLNFPLKFVYKFAIFLSDLHYIFARKDRAVVTSNLKAIFPEKSQTEIKKIRLATFRNFAKYLVDFFRFSLLNKENIQDTVRVENLHYIDEALTKGNGVITFTAHIGNWELAGVTMALLGYSLGVVVLPHRHKKVNDFFTSQREKCGVIVLPLGKAVRRCIKLLRENKLIALVGDRVFSNSSILIDFFGLPAFLPEGAPIFSLKTGAPIIPGFMVRNSDDKYTLTFEKPIYITTPSGDKYKDIMLLSSKCKEIIEEYIRRYPDQWFMFRKFWAEK